MPKDWNGQEIKVGDEVTFGEKATKGKVLGFSEDNRVRVEVIKHIYGQTGMKIWKYIYVFPPGQARVITKAKKPIVIDKKRINKDLNSTL